MQLGRSCRATGAAAAVTFRACVVRASIARACAVFAAAALLAGCTTTGSQTASLAGTRGPSVAFESIDGPPPEVFRKLVARLNEEAQTRRLAVVSREGPSAYRIRGYLAARVEGGTTAISWAWDVYDGDNRRAIRITGAQSRPGKHKASDAWTAADDAMLKAIAGASLDQLATFLAANDDATPAAPAPPTLAAMTADTSSPEAAGIFRIFQAKADPLPESGNAANPGAEKTGTVPLPPLRPERAHQRIAGSADLVMSAHRRVTQIGMGQGRPANLPGPDRLVMTAPQR
jgi:hypothetical protein